MSYQYPRTRDEWWANVEKYWAQLLDIMKMYLPTNQKLMWDEAMIPDSKLDHTFGEGFSKSNQAMIKNIHECKKWENRDLVEYLKRAWRNAPDKAVIHSIPGWNVLCDLLSEENVLYEEPEKEQSNA
jgi:hypothetical protein